MIGCEQMKPGEIPSEEFRAEVARLGRELYESRIRALVEPANMGRYIAIHVDSGDYRVANSTGQAARDIRKVHPPDGRLYMRKIGDEPEYELAARVLASDQYAAARK